MPAAAEFTVADVVNPYGCSETSTLSMYRRPLPSANLRFLSTVMWDGRESSTQTSTQKITFPTNPGDLMFDLAHQALDATNGHAQATTPLTPQQQQAIVNFEMALVTAQLYDYSAGALNSGGATGGPVILGTQTMPAFSVGINDPLGENPFGTPANQVHPHKIQYYLERRDPEFEAKMVQVLHVYKEVEIWREKGAPPPDLVAVLSYDEKPGIQAIENTAPDLPPVPGKHSTVGRDHEYIRHPFGC